MPTNRENPEPESDHVQNTRSMRPNTTGAMRSQIEKLTTKIDKLEKRASAQFGEISDNKVVRELKPTRNKVF